MAASRGFEIVCLRRPRPTFVPEAPFPVIALTDAQSADAAGALQHIAVATQLHPRRPLNLMVDSPRSEACRRAYACRASTGEPYVREDTPRRTQATTGVGFRSSHCDHATSPGPRLLRLKRTARELIG